MQRVAIIGAGAAGLCAARILSGEKIYETVVFELSDHVGGTWFYTDETEKDRFNLPVHSSMYKNMKTNLPKQVMAFPDLPFDSDLPSFLRHQDVQNYLEQYSRHFDLNKYIQFNTLVEDVRPLPHVDKNGLPRWKVIFKNLATNECKNDLFDGVIVCNGHYFKPRIPVIKNQEKFCGKVFHSHQYRTPDGFQNLNVVILGGKSSGSDISIELSKVAKNVILSHKGPFLASDLPKNLQQKVPVTEFTSTGVIFMDGSTSPCDVFIHCTGYEFSFPFLKQQGIISLNENRITPLYKHIVNIDYPNLFFIGVCLVICPFPQFHCQMSYVEAILSGKVQLPPKEKMLEEESTDYKKRLAEGLSHREAHLLGPRQWDYNNNLADLSGMERIPNYVKLLYDLCHQRKTFNLLDYKKDEYELSDEGSYILKPTLQAIE